MSITRLIIIAIAFTAVVCAVAPALAQGIADPAAVAAEIIVTASALPEDVASTPAAATVLTRDDIEERAARDVADLLREVPGLSLSRTGSQGRATSLFTRGSNSTHTLVLWNGIELTNPYFAGYDWGRFSTAGVEQVEVVRGPYSALYGSDAMAGVVNILTGGAAGFSAGLERGGNGLSNVAASGNFTVGELGGAAMFELRGDDGFSPNDDFAQRSASVRVGYAWTPSTTTALLARHTEYDLGIPVNSNGAGDALVPSPRRRQDGTETQIAIPFEQTFRRLSWEILLSESRRDDAFDDPDDPYGMTSAVTESRAQRSRLTARAPLGRSTLVVGGEYERVTVDDVTTFGSSLENARRTETSLFLEDRATFRAGRDASIELAAGARYDAYDTFGSHVSPRVAIALVRGRSKWRLGLGEAFRAPAVGELYFPWSGNAALQPERSRNVEAGFDRATAETRFSATLFSSDYDQLIVFDLLTQKFANVGAASARGLELSVDRRVGASIRTALSYTFTDTEEQGSGRQLLRRPRHAGSLAVSYSIGRTQTHLVILHTGVRADVLPVFPYSRLENDAYTTADLNVQLKAGRFTPYVKVENATGTEYEEVRGYPSPGRRFIAGVRYAR